MFKKTVFYYLSSLLLATAMLTSCVDELNLSDVDGSVLLDQTLGTPVAEINLTMANIIDYFDTNNELIEADDSIIFENTDTCEFRFRVVDLVEKSQESTKQFVFPVGGYGTVPADTDMPTIGAGDLKIQLNTDTENQRVDSARITTATFEFTITKTSLDGLEANNTEITITFAEQRVVNASDNSEYKLIFTPTSFNSKFTVTATNLIVKTHGGVKDLEYSLSVKAKTGSNSVDVSAASAIDVTTKVTKMDFSVAYGFYKPSTIATRLLTSNIKVAEYVPGAAFKFVNPKVYVTATSNIGAFLKFNVDYIEGYYDKDSLNSLVRANFNGEDSISIPLDKKPASYLAPNNWISTQLPRFDKDNGGTDQLYDKEIKPNKINYRFSVQTDDTHPNTTPDFITPDGIIRVAIRTQVAFDLKSGSHYELSDTIRDIGTKITEIVQTIGDDVNLDADVELVLLFTNGLPLQVDTFKMKFLDANGAEIPTTVEKEYVLNLPINVDTEGITQEPKAKQRMAIKLNRTILQELKSAKDMAIFLPIKTGTDKRMQITRSSTFGIKLGLYVKGKSKVTLW